MTDSITYRTFIPPAHLRPYVQCYWLLRQEFDTTEESYERIYPDGSTEIIFQLIEGNRRKTTAGTILDQPKAFFFGQIQQAIDILPASRSYMLGIRFTPSGSCILGMPIDRMSDREWTLDAVLPKTLAFENEIMDIDVPLERKLASINVWLTSLVSPPPRHYDIILDMVRQVQIHGGNQSVAQLKRRYALSIRQLERLFKRYVGLSIKTYARIVRFHSVLKQLGRPENDSLSHIGYQHGYYDQAHFIKDFYRTAGTSPGQLDVKTMLWHHLFAGHPDDVYLQ